MQRIVGLDSLRFVAVAIIVVYHLFSSYLPLPGGFIGVDLFFCLSGFLITSIMLKRKKGGKTGDRIANYGPFIWRRVKRILPSLIVTVLLTLNLLWLVPCDMSTQIGLKAVGALTFLTNIIEIVSGGSYEAGIIPNVFEHTWSLGVEMQFYLIWPLVLIILAAIFKKGNHKYVAMFVAAVLLAVGSGLLMYYFGAYSELPNRAYFGLDSHASGLMLGSLLAIVYTWRRAKMKQPQKQAPVKTILLFICVGIIVATIVWLAVNMPFDNYYTFRVGLSLTAGLGTLLILCILFLQPFLSKHIPLPTEYLGKLAYGIYLFHWPLFIIVPFILPQTVSNETMLALVTVASVGLAVLNHELIEKGRWLKLFKSKSLVLELAFVFVLTASMVVPVYVVQNGPERSSIEIMLEEQALQAQFEAAEAVQIVIDEHRLATALAAENVVREAAAEAERARIAALPPPPPVIAEGTAVLVIGDSVTLGARSALKSTMSVYVDAAGSRNILAAPGVIRSYLRGGYLPRIIVISLITNTTTWNASNLDNIISAAGDGHVFVFVTGWCGPNYPREIQNDRLRAYAGSHSNVVIADWWAIAKDHPEYMYSDGIHLDESGRIAYAGLIAGVVSGL